LEPDARVLDARMVDDASSVDAPLPIDAAPCCVESHYASFPMPSTVGEGLPHEARFAAMGARVEDEITGRIWQRETDGVRRNLEESIAYCEALVLDGQSDFHLPTRIELVTLLELARSPTVDAALMPTEPEYHWSSSRYAARPTSAFSVYFGAGTIDLARGANRSALARCVARPSGEAPAPGPVLEGALVFDAGTGLRWMRRALPASNYAEAETACAAQGMRMPTLRELASTLHDARTAPAIDTSLFLEGAGLVWTRTRSTAPSERWVIDVNDGRSRPLGEAEMASARCVMP
jgi:hypothetical protein